MLEVFLLFPLPKISLRSLYNASSVKLEKPRLYFDSKERYALEEKEEKQEWSRQR